MECDICRRGYDAHRLPFLCPVDARNRIYPGRIENVHLLLENERLQEQIHGLLSADGAKSSKDAVELSLAKQRLVEDRTSQILAAADKLRDEIRSAKEEIKARTTALARRRSDLASVSDGLQERWAKQQHEMDKSIQMASFRWSQCAEDTARTRSFLCTEAIRLYGLKRTRKSNTSRYDYHIGKIPVVDLTSMDSLAPEVISTSLAHVAHILLLVSHYLAVRLPAEITLPHGDYPHPTIFSLASSYRHRPPLPFSSGPVTTPSSAHARDSDTQHVPRPRPLFVDKPPAQLSKDDPAMYSFFLEGVTLLAYDIAWLCSCQGVSIGDKDSFEDICHIGRNLYTFVLSSQLQAYVRLPVKTANQGGHGHDGSVDVASSPSNWIGRYSHGTMYYYLGGVEGTEFVRTFKLPSPMKLADKLKKKLLGDAAGVDWEVLDDEAWKPDEAPNHDWTTKGKSHAIIDKLRDQGGKALPRTGSNGWTKVKPRA